MTRCSNRAPAVNSIANAVNISSDAVPMSGSTKIGMRQQHGHEQHRHDALESDRTPSPSAESLAARNSTSASFANSEGWNESAWKPSQRRAPPVAKPTCGISVSTSSTNVQPTSAGASGLSLR